MMPYGQSKTVEPYTTRAYSISYRVDEGTATQVSSSWSAPLYIPSGYRERKSKSNIDLEFKRILSAFRPIPGLTTPEALLRSPVQAEARQRSRPHHNAPRLPCYRGRR